MKSWSVILILALAIVILISPALIGRLAERNVDDNLARVDIDNESISIRSESYQRGWFTSEGRHRIAFEGGLPAEFAKALTGTEDEQLSGTPALIVDTRLDHGLVPVSSMQREHGTLSPGLANAVSSLQFDRGDGEPVKLPGKIYSAIGLGGGTSFRLLMEAGNDAAGQMTWQGADLTYSVSMDNLEQALTGVIEPVMIDARDVRITLGTLTIDAMQDRRTHPLGEGSIELELESLLISAAEDYAQNVSVGPLILHTQNDIDDGRTTANVELQTTLTNLPGIGSADFELFMEADDLDADALASIIRTYAALSRSPDGSAASEPPAAFRTLMRELEKLVQRGGRIDISNASASLPQGDWQMSLTAELPTETNSDSFSWPGVLLRTSADIETRVSARLFDYLVSINPQLRSALATGMLRKEGDDYEMLATLEGGRLTVNGAPLQLPLGLPR